MSPIRTWPTTPCAAWLRCSSALLAQPLDSGSTQFDPSNIEITSIDVGNKTVNLIPQEARARFNIRFNDCHTRETLRSMIEQRAAAAASGKIRWRIEWDPSNVDVYLTSPGPFVELVQNAVADVTGKRPALSTTGGTSDARFIKDYCQVVDFGLVNETMHKIDERVPTADLVTLTAIYKRVLERYFQQPSSES